MASRLEDPLRFVPATREAFSFLEQEYGFKRVIETPSLMRYEKEAIFVNVICEIGINVLIGRHLRLRDGLRGLWRQLRHEWGVEFPVEDLAALATESLEPARSLVDSADDVRERLEQLAGFVQRHAHGLLSGDERSYRAIAAIGRRRSRELTEWAGGKSAPPG